MHRIRKTSIYTDFITLPNYTLSAGSIRHKIPQAWTTYEIVPVLNVSLPTAENDLTSVALISLIIKTFKKNSVKICEL